MKVNTEQFRLMGRAEGVSLLLLFFVAMPVKYLLQEPMLVRVIGMLHGLLFLGYVAMAYLLSEEQGWGRRKLIMSFICSVLPGGTFYFEKKYLGS